MGKGTSIALIVIGLLMFLFFGLGGLGALFITASYMRYMEEPGRTSMMMTLILTIAVMIIAGFIIPFLLLWRGISSYRTITRIEREQKELEIQLEKERKALELEKIRTQRKKIVTGEIEPQPEVPLVKEREVIKEREIVKIRCRYCGKLFDERLDKCPHCGAPA